MKMPNIIDLSSLSLVDLTHILTPEIPHWENKCCYQMRVTSDYHDCTSEVKFRSQHLDMHAGIGTHMDVPAHCFSNATTVDAIPLQKLVASCFVIDVSAKSHETYKISPEDVAVFEKQFGTITPNAIVLFNTGWSKYWNEPQKYRNNLIFPSISKEVAEMLVERDVFGIGIDTLSPDLPETGYPVHESILGANKFIIENVANISELPPIGSYIIALPLKIKNGTEAPIRLIGLINH